MSDSALFKPNTSGAGLGKKSMDKGQFANPPAYPDVSGFSGPSTVKPDSASVMPIQKTPTAKKGRV